MKAASPARVMIWHGDQVTPAALLGHGSPSNASDDNRYTRAWRAFGEAVPTPDHFIPLRSPEGQGGTDGAAPVPGPAVVSAHHTNM